MLITKEKINKVDIERRINDYIRQKQFERFIIVVPTNRKLRQLKKEMIDLAEGNTTGTVNIETLGTLFEKLLLTNENFIALSEASSTVLIEQASREVKLNYFTNYKSLPSGTLKRIKNVISEYKKHGIMPEDLRRESVDLNPSEKLKALDIANIFEVYRNKCLQLNALETGDIYARLLKLTTLDLSKIAAKVFEKGELLLINGFDEFTKPEVEILSKLAEIKNIQLFIEFDYFKYNPLIFSHLDKCYDRLTNAGFKKVEDTSAVSNPPFKELIRSNLFLSKENISVADYKEKVVKINALSLRSEVELIAKEIKELIIQHKTDPNKICAAFNIIDNYSPVIRDVFENYGIPFNLTDRTGLDKSLPVIALVSFLEILENDFYYRTIFKALNNGFLDLNKIDKQGLKKAASELKIVSGKFNWESSITETIENFELLNFDNRKLDLQRLKKAREDFNYLIELFLPFSKKMTIREFHSAVENLIHKLGILTNLLSDAEGREEANIKGLTTFLETIREIFELIEAEEGSDKTYNLKYFLDTIKTACKWARFNVKEKPDYGVLVTTVNEIRGLQFDYLFVGGMIDSNFPTRYNPEIFFSGSFRKQEYIYQTEERYHFYQTICSWNKKLYLSVPAKNEKKELVESNFLKDLSKIIQMGEKSSEDYSANIYSVDEGLIAAGNERLSAAYSDFLESKNFNTGKIKEAIMVDSQRSSTPFDESEFNGFINLENADPEILTKLSEIGNKQFSISQLETYAKCPFKFFTERILKIDVEEEPTEEVEAIELGSILHVILFEFYITLKKKNIILKNCSDQIFDEALKIIFKIAEDKIESHLFKAPISFFEKERILGYNGNRKESILYKFVQTDREADDNFHPKYFEVSFGKSGGENTDDELSSFDSFEIEGIKLAGKIDRLEINSENQFNVVDYKLSGAKPTKSELEEGISLQLPVYLLAANSLLNKKLGDGFFPNDMIIYSLKYKDGKFGKNKVSLSRSKKADYAALLEDILASTKEHVKSIVENIHSGKFNLTTLEKREEKVCRYCEFKSVCRVEEII